VPYSESGSLKSLLAAQLGMCIAALKAGKQDQVLRMLFFLLVPFTLTSCSTSLYFTAQSGGHEVWNAVFDLVKNVSEIMMSTLPNFWKIAKGFLEGKYRKVRRHCYSEVRSTDYSAVGT
jgi:exocyst complex component 2